MNKRLSIPDIFFLLILAGLTIAFYKILSPFIISIFIAVILSKYFKKPYEYFIKKIKIKKIENKKKLAALLTCLIAVVILIIPTISLIVIITKEAGEGYIHFKNNLPTIQEKTILFVNGLYGYIKNFPIIGDYLPNLPELNLKDEFASTLGGGVDFLVKLIQKTFANMFAFILHSFIILLLIYFLLREGAPILNAVKKHFPLKNDEEDALLKEIGSITDAIVKGTFVIAIIEGTLGAILLAIAGVSSPILLGALMALLSMVPILGTNGILVPIGIILLIMGNVSSALLVLIVGVIGVLISQNIIKPALLGESAGLPPTLILLSTIGGIAWMGLIGFLIGPLIAGLFIVIWRQFGKRFKAEIL